MKQSGAVQHFRIASLTVRVISAREVYFGGRVVSESCYCKIHLEPPDDPNKRQLSPNTASHKMDEKYSSYDWDEVRTLEPISSLQLVLCVRLFRSKGMFGKDKFMCGARIPLDQAAMLFEEDFAEGDARPPTVLTLLLLAVGCCLE